MDETILPSLKVHTNNTLPWSLYLMMSKKSPVSHTIPTRSTPDLPNIEKDLTKSTGVVPVKDPPKVKLEESSNNIREYEF